VEGDTNSVIAGALAASKLGVKIGHVEAGLRSYDRRMPEEINRVLTDHISDYLFAPTQGAKENLLREGIEEDKILVTGNTVVDAVIQNLELAKKKSGMLKSLGLEDGRYILVTAHRVENVDTEEKFAGIINGLKMIHDEYNLPIILPLHPRSQKMLETFNLDTKELTIIPPASYLDFLQLEAHARAILTDSGGVQEEACILGVPCVTLRENTERPETISVGANRLSGTDSAAVLSCYDIAINSEIGWVNPFGDGHSGDFIINYLRDVLEG
ncbi:MAG: UDP-N-acetylglucosamine 2-epimerase (non-hydrolyzing), partial [Candidatus Bathyarchaeota archaeon]|nr:UDP-N-acetylglucosamine 2-epimerase (non-hydrolyzing) [Candidatus Bathyarchaeota archaeon]